MGGTDEAVAFYVVYARGQIRYLEGKQFCLILEPILSSVVWIKTFDR
jgi:hypothetical protein